MVADAFFGSLSTSLLYQFRVLFEPHFKMGHKNNNTTSHLDLTLAASFFLSSKINQNVIEAAMNKQKKLIIIKQEKKL